MLTFGFLTGYAQETAPCEQTCKSASMLIYCSCSYTHHGLPVGEISYSFYALIADEGKPIHIDYYEDRGSSNNKVEYPATEKDVCELAHLLKELKVEDFNGYNEEELMCGGTTYRIYMEYSDGKKLEARWLTQHPKPEAAAAYGEINNFLRAIAQRQKNNK